MCIWIHTVLYSISLLGYLYENSTGDTRFTFVGLTPYTRYKVVVRAKAAGEVGPRAEDEIITPAEGEKCPRPQYDVHKYLILFHR